MGLAPATVSAKATARAKGETHYFTGRPCKRGHVTKRYTVSGMCCACSADNQRGLQKAKPEKMREMQAKWRANNPDKVSAKWKRWADKDKPAQIARCAKWRANNPEKVNQSHAAWVDRNRKQHNAKKRAWAKANPDKLSAWNATRRARKISATPPWLSDNMRADMLEFYKRARILTGATGVRHVVDHIVPLCSPIVCGLHVPWNLQVITYDANASKGNTFSL